MAHTADLKTTFKIFIYNSHSWLYWHILYTVWFGDLLGHMPSVKREPMQLYVYKLKFFKSDRFTKADFTSKTNHKINQSGKRLINLGNYACGNIGWQEYYFHWGEASACIDITINFY